MNHSGQAKAQPEFFSFEASAEISGLSVQLKHSIRPDTDLRYSWFWYHIMCIGVIYDA